MLNELGVLLGVSHKIKRNKNHIYQWLRGVCFVPIIAPVISNSYALFVPSLYSLWDRFGTEHPKIETICRACSVR
jgi:hypothetical protein